MICDHPATHRKPVLIAVDIPIKNHSDCVGLEFINNQGILRVVIPVQSSPLPYYTTSFSFGITPAHGSFADLLTFIPTLPAFENQSYIQLICHLSYVKRVNLYSRPRPLPDGCEQVHNITAQTVNLINNHSID